MQLSKFFLAIINHYDNAEEEVEVKIVTQVLDIVGNLAVHGLSRDGVPVFWPKCVWDCEANHFGARHTLFLILTFFSSSVCFFP